MATKPNRFLVASIGFAIGVVIGQLSIMLAFNPYRFILDSAELAGQSYRLGCDEAGGKSCLLLGTEYTRNMLKNFNSR